MEFINEHYPQFKFYLHLVSDVKSKEFLNCIENNQNYENILILNPDYVSVKYKFMTILDYFYLSYYPCCT